MVLKLVLTVVVIFSLINSIQCNIQDTVGIHDHESLQANTGMVGASNFGQKLQTTISDSPIS